MQKLIRAVAWACAWRANRSLAAIDFTQLPLQPGGDDQEDGDG